MENVQAPYLIQKGFKRALGYCYFWLAYECCCQGQPEKGIGYYKKVLETLSKSNVFYAAALGAVHIEQRKLREGIIPNFLGTTGEELEYRDNKLYFVNQPGYSSGEFINSAIFWNCSCCDGIIYDGELNEGESMTSYDSSNEADRYILLDSNGEILNSSNNSMKVFCKNKNATVETPVGTYENCICYVFEGDYYGLKYCETYFCRGVGIVKQIVDSQGKREEWQLSKCRINGGDEIIPFAEGNRWEYCLVQDTDKKYDTENVFEIVFTEEEKAVFSSYIYVKALD